MSDFFFPNVDAVARLVPSCAVVCLLSCAFVSLRLISCLPLVCRSLRVCSANLVGLAVCRYLLDVPVRRVRSASTRRTAAGRSVPLNRAQCANIERVPDDAGIDNCGLFCGDRSSCASNLCLPISNNSASQPTERPPGTAVWFRVQKGRVCRLLLGNAGLGPAIIDESSVSVDGQYVGPFNRVTINRIRGSKRPRPSAMTGFDKDAVIPADFREFLLRVDDYDPTRQWHANFATLIEARIAVKFVYSSMYGGEKFLATWPRDEPDESDA